MPSLAYNPPPVPEGQEPPPPKEPELLFDGVVKKRRAHGIMHTMQTRHLSIYEDRLEYSTTGEKDVNKQVIPRAQVLSWAEKPGGLFDVSIALDPEKPDTKTYSFNLADDQKKNIVEALRSMSNPGRADRVKLNQLIKSYGEGAEEETTNESQMQNTATFIMP